MMVRTTSSHCLRQLTVFHCLFLIGFAAAFTNDFKPIRVDDIDLLRFSEEIGHFDLMTCFMECAVKEHRCLAFFRSPSGDCRIIKTTGSVLPEKGDAASIQVWLRTSALINPNCSDIDFPISRGRSRYRFQFTEKNWTEAKSDCEAINSKLLELSTTAEREFIAGVIRGNPKAVAYVHVGLKKQPGSIGAAQGWEWYWSREAMFQGWDERNGQPNGDGSLQNVGAIQRASGFLHDVSPETFFLNSICECMLI